MKHIQYLLILFLFITMTAIGQNIPDSGFRNKAEAKNLLVNGVKEGKWLEYRAGGGIVTGDTNSAYTLTVYKAGKPYGIVRWYMKTGELKSECPYTNGKENGTEKVYSGGKLWIETIYVNGKAGKTTSYDENGKEVK